MLSIRRMTTTRKKHRKRSTIGKYGRLTWCNVAKVRSVIDQGFNIHFILLINYKHSFEAIMYPSVAEIYTIGIYSLAK